MAASGYISPNGNPIPGKTNPVALVSPRQQFLEERRELPRTLMEGTDAMRAAGEKYLPKHPAESSDSYKARLHSTTLYGAFSKTVVRQAGKMFTRPVTMMDADPTMVAFSNDVDGAGRSMTAFANDCAKEGFVDGVSYLFVDFPTVPVGATQADVQQIEARPYWILIHPRAVLGWKSMSLGGQHRLTQFRFREIRDEATEGEFEATQTEIIRVLDRGGLWRAYRKVKTDNGQEDWVQFEEGQASWIEIPIVPVYVNRVGFMEGLPPLRELAELNHEHWISSSEQRRALSFLRFAMLALIGRAGGTGKNATAVKIAPDKIIDLPAGGDAKYVEHSGAGIAAGLSDLQAIEARMQTAGMEVRIENAGQVTATAAAIDSVEGNAALKAIVKGIESSLNEALMITAEFLNVTQVGKAKVDDEFAQEPPEGGVNEFIALYGAGLASQQTVWDELVRRHILDDDFDAEKEAIQIATEQLTLQKLAMAQQEQLGIAPQQPQEEVPQ